MKTKKILAISLIYLTPMLFLKEQLKNENRGMFIVEPTPYFLPAFPKITVYNKKDTLIYQGNILGQAEYNLPEGKYKIRVEQGIDSLTNEKGDYFNPYEINVKLRKDDSMKKLSNLEKNF